MDYKQPRSQPESKAAKRLCNYMEARGWGVWKVGAGKYVSGWPDYYAFHPQHGHRWIETKAPGGKLRGSQIKRFRSMTKAGDSIFVLEDEKTYARLFQPANWELYIRGVL